MPRNQNGTNIPLRNRNRVTNKTRLKVLKGNVDADPIVLDEDEERARVVSTAGVDAEDANEHHLQAVLSAASHRATSLAQKASRNSPEKQEKKYESSTVFIPVPDAAGVVENFSDLYPAERWKEPVSYVKFSCTVEESVSLALADGFTYVMDERDAEWLGRNNQEARGEGTSTQAAGASGGTSTRSGNVHRSAKSRGKDVEMNTPAAMSEDEFELVMGLFEKLTHDSTPFLHLSVQQGVTESIPSFNEYQDIFANPLPPSLFATFIRPDNVPPPATLSRMARLIYPYWRERKIEREGHRIIPALNFDESDTKNESYVCFRRREIKAIRKTRTAQVSVSERMRRLKAELECASQLAEDVLKREAQKREAVSESRNVWEKRQSLVDLKRQFPGVALEEELLFDKERQPKKPKPQENLALNVVKLKNRASGELSASPTPPEPAMRPKDRLASIQAIIDEHLKRQKERDNRWEDQLDNAYQPSPVPYSDRLFKVAHSLESTTHGERRREPKSLRHRVGRGGRTYIDRRSNLRLMHGDQEILRYRSHRTKENENHASQNSEDEERLARLQERWRYDVDSSTLNTASPDEEDRILVDDYEPKYLKYSVKLLQELDHGYLTTDPRLFLSDGHNGFNMILPFRVGIPQTPRRDSTATPRPLVNGISATSPVTATHPQVPLPPPVAQPVAVQTPIKKLATPALPQQTRSTPANTPSHPPNSQPQIGGGTNPSQSDIALLPAPSATSNAPSANGLNNSSLMGNATGVTQNSALGILPSVNNGWQVNGINGMLPIQDASAAAGQGMSPPRPKSQNQMQVTSPQQALAQIANGNQLNGVTNGAFAGFQNVPLTPAQQQLILNHKAQSLTRAYSGMQNNQAMNGQQAMQNPNGVNARPNMHSSFTGMLPNGLTAANIANLGNMNAIFNSNNVNVNLKAKQLQLAQQRASQQQAAVSANGVDGTLHLNGIQMPGLNGNANVGQLQNGLNGHMSPGRPSQSPSNQMMNPSPNHSLMSHAMQNSPRLGSPSQAHLSPQRNMQTPIPTPSPLMQHQQIISGLNQGPSF